MEDAESFRIGSDVDIGEGRSSMGEAIQKRKKRKKKKSEASVLNKEKREREKNEPSG